jgi:S1-C subfamily serine protease
MLSKLCSGIKTMIKLVGMCLKGLILTLTVVWMLLGLVYVAAMLTPPRMVSTLQVERGLPPLTPSVTYNSERSIVRIYLDGQFTCTGIVIGSNYVITAGHCITNDDDNTMTKGRITVQNDDLSVKVQARAVGINTRLDWGLIQGDFSKIPGAHLVSRALEIPPKVVACGYPMASHYIDCEVLTPVVNDGFLVKCAGGMVLPGMSGGPVFDKDGNVIGLNVQAYMATENGGAGYSPTLGILSSFGIGD